MNDLETAIGLVLAAHPGPAAARLMMDCWALGVKYGESEGLRYLAVYKRCFDEYEADRRVRRSFRTHTATVEV